MPSGFAAPDEHREFHAVYHHDCRAQMRANRAQMPVGFPDDKGRQQRGSPLHRARAPRGGQRAAQVAADCDKEMSIGMYRNDDRPAAMTEPELARRTGRFTDGIAVCRWPSHFSPANRRRWCWLLGAAEDVREDAHDLIRRYTSVEASEHALQAVHAFWARLLNAERVETRTMH
ncbi:MAG: hypothetical protein U0452_09945 [Anaerolineae bacterium]